MLFNRLNWFLAVTLFVTFSALTIAQEEKDEWDWEEEETDTSEEYWGYGWDDDDSDWNWEFDWDSESKPFMELNYGLGNPKHKSIRGDFTEIGSAQLRLGYRSVEEYKDPVLEVDENFFELANLSSDLGTSDTEKDYNTKLWRFGLGWTDGYGYGNKDLGVLLYNQNSFLWSRLETETDSYLGNDQNRLDLFNEALRFGSSVEGGAKVELGGLFSVNGSYQASVIFPRHMFWYHSGSLIVRAIGMGSIDYFVGEVLDSTPEAAPVVNFLLKNGFSYAFHVLQRENMNFPFDTAPALTYETYKIGVTFTF